MECMTGNQAVRRFRIRSLWSAALVILFAFVATASFRRLHLDGVVACLVAILPALPILWAIVAAGQYLAEEKDEVRRNLLVQCLLGGIGGTLATTTAWGYLEAFVHVPHLQAMWIYPIFWLFVMIAMPVVKARYR